MYRTMAGEVEGFNSILESPSSYESPVFTDFWKEQVQYFDWPVVLAAIVTTATQPFSIPAVPPKKAVQNITQLHSTGFDLMDWETRIDNPPAPKHTEVIKLKLVYVGRSKPIPLTD
jgi:hypothetical protein